MLLNSEAHTDHRGARAERLKRARQRLRLGRGQERVLTALMCLKEPRGHPPVRPHVEGGRMTWRSFGAGVIGLWLATCSCGSGSAIRGADTPSAPAVSSPVLPAVSENLSVSGSLTVSFAGIAGGGSALYPTSVSICRRVTHMHQSAEYGAIGLWVWLGVEGTTYHFWILVPKFAGQPKTFDPALRSEAIFINESTALMMTDSTSDHWGDWKTAWITTAGTASVESVDSAGHVVSGKIDAELTEELQNKGTVHVKGTWSCPYDTSQPKPLEASL
jgi:hypothetical protein